MIFYSHTEPERRLIEHLKQVAAYSRGYGEETMGRIHEIVGYAHDFGKYTTYFQEDRLFKRKKWGEKAHHAYLSAVFGAWLCFEEANGMQNYTPLWVFSSILSHHGDLKDFFTIRYLPFLGMAFSANRVAEEKLELMETQLANMRKNINDILADFSQIGLEQQVKEFLISKDLPRQVLQCLRDLASAYEAEPEENEFWIHQQIYSCLIAADKMSAAGIKPVSVKNMPFIALEEQRQRAIAEKKEAVLSSLRNEIFQDVQAELEKVYEKASIFSITAPTGTGKTFTGFFAAKKLQELLGNKHKIIYALPFTAIINQNYDVIYKLHAAIEAFEKNESTYILKHHHLTNKEYENEEEDYQKDQMELLIENWDSGVVITTFVQLLQTLVGDRNRMLKKYHSITQSIILLDEVQAIPIEYFKMVNYIFQKIVNIFNCKIILMTATKPLFFTKTQELLKDYEKYFLLMHRTTLYPDMNSVSLQDFCSDFLQKAEREKSYLIVANTIAQSLDIYFKLKGNVAHELYYLSTNLLPMHRQDVLNIIEKKLELKEKIILISTQVVEAGVNLDFNGVIRDIAPLDSIIQCAGRCNRHSGPQNGRVRVVCMTDEKGKRYAGRVYGSAIINLVKDLLGRYERPIPESEYLPLIQEYYKAISAALSMQASEDIIKAIQYLNFSKDHGVGTFSLIEQKYDYVDLYIEFDDLAVELLRDYADAMKLKDQASRREKLNEIRQSMQQYVISIPVKYAKRFEKGDIENSEFFILRNANVSQHYDEKTGLKRNEEFDMFCF